MSRLVDIERAANLRPCFHVSGQSGVNTVLRVIASVVHARAECYARECLKRTQPLSAMRGGTPLSYEVPRTVLCKLHACDHRNASQLEICQRAYCANKTMLV